MKKKIFYYILIVNLVIIYPSLAWWNPEWQYRQKLTINNKANIDIQKDFTINYTLNTINLISQGKMKQDCSDLRIIKDDITQIDRLVLDCNKNNTIIQFKLQNRIQTIDDTYYMYYGNNESDTPLTNKSNVYYFYEDFENYDLSQKSPFDNWYSNGGNWRIDGNRSFSGTKSLFENGLAVGWKTINNTKVNVENFTYIAYGMIGTQRDVWSFGVNFDTQNYTDNYRLVWYYEIGKGGWLLQLRKVVASNEPPISSTFANELVPKLNQWYEFKIIRLYPHIKVYINNSLIFNINDSTYKSGSIGFSRYSNLPETEAMRTSWYDDAIVMLYMEPWPEVTLGEEESFNQLDLYTEIPKEIFVNEPFTVTINVYQNNQPIRNLTLHNFNITDNNADIELSSLANFNNGTYSIRAKINSNFLGKHNILVKVKYSDLSGNSITQTILLARPKTKILIITDQDWKNYIQSVSTGYPVLVYNSTKHLIDHFIASYNPEQIFLLNSNLALNKDYYYIDRDTLSLMFFRGKEVAIVNDKETAITSSMLNLPIIISPSEEALLSLNPTSVHVFNSTSQAEIYYLTKRSRPTNHIVLVNPDGNNAMFAAALAFKKNAFIIQSKGNEFQSKLKLKDNIEKSGFDLTQPFIFASQAFLTLIDVPHFLVQDPVDDGLIDPDGDWIETDTPYGDINDDEYLDISVGRLEGKQEQISYQLETLPPQNKDALIIAAYNTPSKIIDLMTGGSDMTSAMNIEGYLGLKGFKVTRIVEKRSSYDSINKTTISELVDIIKSLMSSSDQKYEDVILLLTSSLQQIKLLFTTGFEVVYAIDEFNWKDAFTRLIEGKEFTAQHLPIFTEDNVKGNIQGKSVIAYMGDGNSSHWFEPNITASGIKPRAISNLPFNPSFYYIHYTKGYESHDALADKGALAVIASTGNTYLGKSSYVGVKVFDNFNGPVGIALKDAKNDILEFYKSIEDIRFSSSPKPYKKEYYTRNLVGDPSSTFDPFLELKQSQDIKMQGGNFLLSFEIKPKYSIIVNNGKKSIYFHNPDSLIFIDNKPIVPVYKESISLPEESDVNSVSIITSKSQYDNLEIPISYPDPRYSNTTENFTGQFPQNFYWNGTFSLLDNRKIYDFIFIPVIYFSNNSALVHEKINVDLVYSSPFEITRIHANNTVKDQPATIELTTYSNLPSNTEAAVILFIETEKSNFTSRENFLLKKGINEVKINWPNTNEIGNYSVTLVMIANNITSSPKYTYFEVKPKPLISSEFILPFLRNIYIDFSKFIEAKSSFKESIRREVRDGKEIIDYKSWNVSVHIEMAPDTSVSIMKMQNAELIVEETPLSKKYELHSSDGIMTIETTRGMKKQTYTGNPIELTNKMNESIKIYNEILSKVIS